MRDIVRGAGYLGRGFAMWRRRPGLMLLGMVPALIVFVVLLAAFVALCFEVGGLVDWATPFADGWADAVRGLFRVLLAIAVLGGALFLASSVFVGLTMVVGDPFYEKVWAETEKMLGGPVPAQGPGLASAVRDGLVMTGVSVGIGAGIFVLGFLPVLGTVVGAGLGLVASGRLLAGELLARPLEARGLDRAARFAVLKPHRARVLGFGVVSQLCCLVPLGAVVMMPAAVVGATILARDVLDEPKASSATTAPSG